MEISFLELRNREVVNIYSGEKLGHITDIIFNPETREVVGIVVPGDRHIFKKNDDLFIPLSKLKRIGSDVVLVGLNSGQSFYDRESENKKKNFNGYMPQENRPHGRVIENSTFYKNSNSESKSYVRLRPLSKSKYK